MYQIAKEYHWCMGHALAFHDGKCYRPHGHNYRAIVTVRCPAFPDQPEHYDSNMLMEFAELDDALKEVIEALDHNFFYNARDPRGKSFHKVGAIPWHTLTDDPLNHEPTAEGIAKYLALKVKRKLPDVDVAVEVFETPKCSAIYSAIGPNAGKPAEEMERNQ